MTFASDTPAHVDLIALYEQLRRRVLDGGRGVPLCALLQRQGMRTWIDSCRRVFPPVTSVCLPPTPAAPKGFCGEIVHLIAAMVLQIQQQGANT